VREYLVAHRHELGQQAVDLYADTLKVADTALVSRPDWLPPEPIPLLDIDLTFAPDELNNGIAPDDPATDPMLPVRSDGSRYRTYSEVMADLTAPAVFENRRTYRLLSADLTGPRGAMTFGRGMYFDGIDLGESVAHEYAAHHLDGTPMPLRRAIGDPCDPTRRPTNMAISILTIREDRASGEATFVLHWRDPAKVGHAGGLYMVAPVGIFQASDDQEHNERHDFSLWRCAVREYAEEFLGESENYGSGPIGYESWPFAADLARGLSDGQVRADALGLGVDPLTLATDLVVTASFDAPVFDRLFARLVDTNSEGRLVRAQATPDAGSRQFSLSQAPHFALHEPVQAAGAAALALASSGRGAL
jgi:hypothetical protein